jgi:hypothetical protein
MGAAASSGSDTTPADDLAASFESWVTSGGERCAAAIAALEAASPALAAALRSADADAVRGALAAAPAAADGGEASADTADSEPVSKRLKPSENSGAAFVEVVLKKDDNASKVLNFAGYRTVLRLEEVCKPAWTALRGGKLELDVSKEKNLSVAVRHAARHEILDARRQGYFPKAYSVTWRYSSSGVQQSTSDVLYHDDSVFLTSPRPRQLFRAASGLDTRDEERSKASLAAFECSKASLLAVGCVVVDVDHRRGDTDAIKLRRSTVATFDTGVTKKEEVGKNVDEARSSKVVEAMGASRAIPRRLVLAASRTTSRQCGEAGPADLARAIRFAADKSAVLDVSQLERLVSAAWRAKGVRNWADITEEVFLIACADAHISDSDAAVAWREACSGVLLPFEPAVRQADTKYLCEPGNVQQGDVAIVGISDWLFSPVSALALTMITNGVYRDPASVFSAKDCYHLAKTFETLVVRLHIADQAGDQVLRLGVLDALAFRRDGEEDDEPGRARVAEAIASLLAPDRVATIAVGSAVECGAVRESTVTVVHPSHSTLTD